MGTMSNDTARKLYERLARLERVAEAAEQFLRERCPYNVSVVWEDDVYLHRTLEELKELDHEES